MSCRLRAANGTGSSRDWDKRVSPFCICPLQKNGSHTGQLFCKDSITNSLKIIFHGEYYTINSGDGAMPIGLEFHDFSPALALVKEDARF